MTIILTPEQANALVHLLDLAVKSAGLSAAGNALFFQQLIADAHKKSLTEAAETSTI